MGYEKKSDIEDPVGGVNEPRKKGLMENEHEKKDVRSSQKVELV